MKDKRIMFQGTSSNVGKSILAAAFCRILKQDGYKVAPFKSQNMALNSFVTKDGGEIGRAQGVQAEAAGVEATIDMNPVLLKPKKDSVAQVIVHGQPVADLTVKNYIKYKPTALESIKQSLD
ncbi:MAG: cobyric acid synthase CobQ, partial [bacterium]